ncbi:MAG: nickel-responsive transcriptional regulator NikR [Leptospiraceae bacterium]|nr:nickel-responsive transcriptional regulator NikR [Leptospiraceae bacterium]MDW7977078.1 nickel-responsive transcriptional regulator NikR [Leptospiraceae bacterium]
METKSDKYVRFSISLPEELLQIMDQQFIDQGYASRSEFIRDLIREKIVADKWKNPEENVIGVLSIIYNHHTSDLSEKMIHIQHTNLINILCNLHIHVNEDDCLEIIVMKGLAKEIQKINIELSGVRGVKFAELTRIAPPEI